MLGKLDDQLDRRDYKSSSPFSLYVASEPTPAMPSPPPIRSPDVSGPTTDNVMIGLRPRITRDMPRQPLASVVQELANQWSAAFLDLAREGDGPSLLLVAQMYLVPKGYGIIRYDRAEGVRWLFKAVEQGEPEARGLAQRICPQEYHQWLERRRQMQSDILANNQPDFLTG